MTVTLDLKPDIGKRLAALAARDGVSVEEYLQRIVEGITGRDEAGEGTASVTAEQWILELEAWVNSREITAPPLSDEAISREGIYREREDSQL
jgi:hypothetical protein